MIPFLIRKFSVPFFQLLFRAFTLYIWKGGGGGRGSGEEGEEPEPAQSEPGQTTGLQLGPEPGVQRCGPPRPFGVRGAASASRGPRNVPPPAGRAAGGRAQPGVWQTPPRVESFASGRFRKRLWVGGPRTGKSGRYGEPDATVATVSSPRGAAALGGPVPTAAAAAAAAPVAAATPGWGLQPRSGGPSGALRAPRLPLRLLRGVLPARKGRVSGEVGGEKGAGGHLEIGGAPGSGGDQDLSLRAEFERTRTRVGGPS